MTRPENLQKKLEHVRATWTKHCNLVLYMSSQSSDFPTVGLNVSEGRSQLYLKTIRAFQYLHAHHLQDANWFLKADDDTFVVVENLRYLLSQHDTEEPVYFGHRFRPLVRQGYMSGGAGYVLSREALRRFVQGFSTGRCKNFSSVEDMALGRCMETMGVKAGDSRDPSKRETFNPFTPENHLISPKSGKQAWSYSYYKTKRVSAAGRVSLQIFVSHSTVKPKLRPPWLLLLTPHNTGLDETKDRPLFPIGFGSIFSMHFAHGDLKKVFVKAL